MPQWPGIMRMGWAVGVSLALCVLHLPAQYRIDTWNSDNGLPINSVNNVLQTHDGFIWIATFAGLVRYDGDAFQVFSPVNSKGLTTSRFSTLFEDRQGNLWITTENEQLLRYANGAFTAYGVAEGMAEKTPHNLFY